MQEISITVNGQDHRIPINPGESLLESLRTSCGVISTKDGCAPQGQCGCCLALVDGKPKVACAVPAKKVAGAEVLTLEGLSARRITTSGPPSARWTCGPNSL